MRLSLIEWEDSCSYSGWHNIHPDCDCISKCISVGILCREDKEQVVLAISKSDSGSYGDTMAIPRSCIKRIRHLKVK